jgi:shikimate kinase
VPSLVLVGLPGSGKSTVGRSLGRRLTIPFQDSDHALEQRIGCSIREFFEREGETRFRDLEHEVLPTWWRTSRASSPPAAAPCCARPTAQLLRQGPHVVYLRSSPEEMYRRRCATTPSGRCCR